MDAEIKFPIALQAYTYFASRYGIGYDSLEIKWMINEDGSALLQRIIEIEAFSGVENLDTYLLIPENDENRKIEFISVDSLSPQRNISLSDVKKEPGKGSAMISISPPLKKEEKMRYKIVEKLPQKLYAINMSSQEISKRQSAHDYCGWNINRPTRKVSLQVEFPNVIKPEEYNLEVRYASTSGFPSTRKHFEESRRFEPVLTLSPQRDKSILRLDVDYPMIGLIYILQWLPVPKETKSDQTSITPDSRKDYLIEIRKILIDRFNVGEMRTLAHDLGVEYDNLPDSGKANKARELVEFLERRNQILELVKLGQELRPKVKWPEYKE